MINNQGLYYINVAAYRTSDSLNLMTQFIRNDPNKKAMSALPRYTQTKVCHQIHNYGTSKLLGRSIIMNMNKSHVIEALIYRSENIIV